MKERKKIPKRLRKWLGEESDISEVKEKKKK